MTRPSFFCPGRGAGRSVMAHGLAAHRRRIRRHIAGSRAAAASRRAAQSRKQGRCGLSRPAALSRRATRRSYHAAWPVIGSALCRASPSPAGSISVIRWFNRNPRVNSGESAARFQAPLRLPIAFQVHTVSGLTPSINLICASIRPAWLDTQTQSSSASPRPCAVTRFMNKRFCPRIWRNQAFCECQEWYICIGRWVIGVQREGVRVDARLLERRIPERQRVEIGLDARPVLCRRHDRAMTLRGQAETLQRLDIELQDDRLGAPGSGPSKWRFRDRPCWHACRTVAPAAARISRSSRWRRSGRAAAGLARPCRRPRRPRRASRPADRRRACARAARYSPCSRRETRRRRPH